MRRLIPLLLLAFWFAGTAPSVAQTGDAILILDASGSMWGQVKKDDQDFRRAQGGRFILAKWKQTDRLGLMAYGHRTKGDCKDIKLVVPGQRLRPG